MGIDSFYSLNIYNLALYDDSELGKEIEHTGEDLNELACKGTDITSLFYRGVFNIGLEIVKQKRGVL